MLGLPDGHLHGKARLDSAAMELDIIPAVAGGKKVDAASRAPRLGQHGVVDIPAVSLRFRWAGASSGSRHAFFPGDNVACRMPEHLFVLACIGALDPDVECAATGL